MRLQVYVSGFHQTFISETPLPPNYAFLSDKGGFIKIVMVYLNFPYVFLWVGELFEGDLCLALTC